MLLFFSVVFATPEGAHAALGLNNTGMAQSSLHLSLHLTASITWRCTLAVVIPSSHASLSTILPPLLSFSSFLHLEQDFTTLSSKSPMAGPIKLRYDSYIPLSSHLETTSSQVNDVSSMFPGGRGVEGSAGGGREEGGGVVKRGREEDDDEEDEEEEDDIGFGAGRGGGRGRGRGGGRGFLDDIDKYEDDKSFSSGGRSGGLQKLRGRSASSHPPPPSVPEEPLEMDE